MVIVALLQFTAAFIDVQDIINAELKNKTASAETAAAGIGTVEAGAELE